MNFHRNQKKEIYIRVFVFIFFVSSFYVIESGPVEATEKKLLDKDESSELKNDKNCKSLCEECGCRGFYCGEECICECDEDNNADIQCLNVMQESAKKLNIPFEVLIQGPSDSKFIQSALKINETDVEKDEVEPPRRKRSTATIYRPGPLPPLVNSIANLVKNALQGAQSIQNISYTANDIMQSPASAAVSFLPAKPAKRETVKSHKRRGINPLLYDTSNNYLVAPAPRHPFLKSSTAGKSGYHKKRHDLAAAASENSLSAGILPFQIPGLKISPQVETAVSKMREAMEHLNNRAEQLLGAVVKPLKLGSIGLGLGGGQNLLGLKQKLATPTVDSGSDVSMAEPRPMWKNLLNLPRLGL